MSETVFVTGATGFIGQRLCDELSDRGYRIIGMSRKQPQSSSVDKWIVGDVRSNEPVREGISESDYVFHLAGISLTDGSGKKVKEVNVEGTRNVVTAALDADIERLVYTSSAGALANPSKGSIVSETDQRELIGGYQRSKAMAEDVVREHVEDGLDAVIVNPTSVFGPGDEKFTSRLLTMASEPKFFVYFPGGGSIVNVDDVVQGHIAALENGNTGEQYILGGENLTYHEAVSILANQMDGSPPVVPIPAAAIRLLGPVAGSIDAVFGKRIFPFNTQMSKLATQSRFFSSEKAERELGYEYEELAEHAPAAIEWYQN